MAIPEVIPETASKVKAYVRGKRVFKILGYVGLLLSLFTQGSEVFSYGFLQVMLFVLLIDLSGDSFELVSEAKEVAEEKEAK
jgi:hypothetical protein